MNKSVNKIHIALDISFALPNKTLTITNANTPAIIPVVILWVSGVTIMAEVLIENHLVIRIILQTTIQ